MPGTSGSKIQHLDQIPFQDYDYRNHYILDGADVRKMDIKVMEQWGRLYMTQPTRGCPFACTFCVNNTFIKMYPHQKPIRKRSVDNLIEELMEVKTNLPFVNQIKFDDDAFFLLPLDEMTEFSRRYKKNIKLPLIITGATPSTLTREKFSVLVDAGLVEIRMGIQSAGERTKKLYKRPHSNEEVEKTVRMVHEYKDNVTPSYDIILDSPWETDEDSIETLMFLSKFPTPYVLTLFSLLFFPGTDLYRKAKKEGIITDDLNDVYRKHYHGCKKTYYNGLYFLLRDYAYVNVRISSKIMFLLLNKNIRLLKLNWVLFAILRMLYPVFRKINKLKKAKSKFVFNFSELFSLIKRKKAI